MFVTGSKCPDVSQIDRDFIWSSDHKHPHVSQIDRHLYLVTGSQTSSCPVTTRSFNVMLHVNEENPFHPIDE